MDRAHNRAVRPRTDLGIGYARLALYLPQPNNGGTVVEGVVGVPSSAFGGEVLNMPTKR